MRDSVSGCRGEEESPHVVIVVLDALRARSMPMYGCPRNTMPFLAELAEKSTVFSYCYAAATWTRPAVASLLTGLHPAQHQAFDLTQPLPSNMPSLPRALGAIGYQTGYFPTKGVSTCLDQPQDVEFRDG